MNLTTEIIQIVLAAVAAIIGYRSPDVDLTPVLPVRHRSFWTHGPLFAVLLFMAAQRWGEYRFVFAAALVGLAIHLIEDAAPKSWEGGAQVKLFPIPGTLPTPASFVWIAGGALTALQCFIWMVRP